VWAVSCTRYAIAVTLMPKSAVKCVFGRTFQGILVACTPSLGQSALGTAQCTIVSYCQMLRCHKVLSRVSQVPHLLWYTGHSTTWPFPVGHPHMELVLRSLALLKPDIAELPLVAESHRALLASLP
jgi:hypothetical protein